MPRTSPEATPRNATALPVLATVTISAPEKVTGRRSRRSAVYRVLAAGALGSARVSVFVARAVVPTTGAQAPPRRTPSPSSPSPVSERRAREPQHALAQVRHRAHAGGVAKTAGSAPNRRASPRTSSRRRARRAAHQDVPGEKLLRRRGVSWRPLSFRGSARRRSRPPSSTRTADASKSSSATCLPRRRTGARRPASRRRTRGGKESPRGPSRTCRRWGRETRDVAPQGRTDRRPPRRRAPPRPRRSRRRLTFL